MDTHMGVGVKKARVIRFPEARVSGGCEPPYMVAGNQTQVHSKSSMYS